MDLRRFSGASGDPLPLLCAAGLLCHLARLEIPAGPIQRRQAARGVFERLRATLTAWAFCKLGGGFDFRIRTDLLVPRLSDAGAGISPGLFQLPLSQRHHVLHSRPWRYHTALPRVAAAVRDGSGIGIRVSRCADYLLAGVLSGVLAAGGDHLADGCAGGLAAERRAVASAGGALR